MTALDAHEVIEWDRDNEQRRLDLHRDILEAIALHAVTGVREALAGANQVTGKEWLEKSYPGLHLPFLGFSDFQGGGRVAELKVKTSAVSAAAKSGRSAGALPSKPDAKHAQQVAYYADVLGCQASLIYASETGYGFLMRPIARNSRRRASSATSGSCAPVPGHVKTSCAVRRTIGH